MAAIPGYKNGTIITAQGALSGMNNFLDEDSSLDRLLQSQQALQATIDSLSDPVVLYGAAGELWPVHRAAAALLGRVVDSRMTALSQS